MSLDLQGWYPKTTIANSVYKDIPYHNIGVYQNGIFYQPAPAKNVDLYLYKFYLEVLGLSDIIRLAGRQP